MTTKNINKLPGYSYEFNLGDDVLIQFGFAKGVVGRVTGFNGNRYSDAFGEHVFPMYEVTFLNPQTGLTATCTYRATDVTRHGVACVPGGIVPVVVQMICKNTSIEQDDDEVSCDCEIPFTGMDDDCKACHPAAVATEKEIKLLRTIADSEYQDGECPVGNAVWLDYIVNTKSRGGIVSSLQKKGFVELVLVPKRESSNRQHGISDSTVAITLAGFNVLTAAGWEALGGSQS